jgi:hypothetical protein
MSATPKQRRSQAAFGAASKAWSENHPLSQEQRAAWYASAAKIESKPRLWQSGFLTAQLHFVGINSRKERWGLPPGARATRAGKKDGRRQGANYEILCTSGATPEAFRAHAGSLHRARKGCAAWATAPRVATHATLRQSLTRATSDFRRAATALMPVRCRWEASSAGRVGRIASPGRHPP